jgi:uncharacterized membrane protein YfcA
MFTFGTVAAIAGIVFFSAVLQRAVGFGFALLAVPLATFVVPTKSAVVIVFLSGWVTSLWLAVRLRHWIEWSTARRLAIGCVVGAPAGVVILSVVPPTALRFVLGVTTCLAALWIIVSSRVFRRERVVVHGATTFALGLVSGVINTSLATSGPPLVYALRRSGLRDDRFRATISLVFVYSNVIGLPLLIAAGLVTSFDINVAATALVPCILGMAAGSLLGAVMRSTHFVWAVDVLLLATGVLTITKALSS